MSLRVSSGLDLASYRREGWVRLARPLPGSLIEPIAETAKRLAVRPPRQPLLSGAHNPFGRGAALFDAWKFLDVCENGLLLDAVEALLGGDLVLWDSELYLDARTCDAARPVEGRYWPAEPLAGLIVDVAVASGSCVLADVHHANAAPAAASGAHYVIRYMPATSRYNRDPRYAPNRFAMEERPLVNYLNRPIWLVRGSDRAGSDFATGFAAVAPAWSGKP